MTGELGKPFRQSTRNLHQRSIGGVTVLHRQSWDDPRVLNRELNLVWTCLEFGGSVEEIAADITEVFNGEPNRILSVVEESFRTLIELDLIVAVNEV